MRPVCEYLAVGSTTLEEFGIDSLPQVSHGVTRIVCISDTHNEHEALSLPWGHLLLHAGDILTESGKRHVNWQGKEPSSVKPSGVELIAKFGQWLGKQPHPHKAVIGGNHDLALQLVGSKTVQSLLAVGSAVGTVAYLQHEAASVGPLRIFGSPYHPWSSQNNGFYCDFPDYSLVPKGIHVLMTHSPAVFGPRREEHGQIVDALHASGALIHIGGHLHWARGFYRTAKNQTPCAIVSIGASWICPTAIVGVARGDPLDKIHGGFAVLHPPIVIDLLVPGGPPPTSAQWVRGVPEQNVPKPPNLVCGSDATPPPAVRRPAVLLCGQQFGGLREELSGGFQLTVADSLEAVETAVGVIAFDAVLIDIHTLSLGRLVDIVRATLGAAPLVMALGSRLEGIIAHPSPADVTVDLSLSPAEISHPSVSDVTALRRHLEWLARKTPTQPRTPAPLLYFAASTDPGAARRLLPVWRERLVVHAFGDAAEAEQFVRKRRPPYFACVFKLRSGDNKAVPLMRAVREVLGAKPVMAVHSTMAARDPTMQAALNADIGIDIFASQEDEAALTQRLLDIGAARQAL